MEEEKPDTQLTFTRKRGATRCMLTVTIGAVIVILVAAVIVLAVLLVSKENNEDGRADSGDKGGQGQPDIAVPLSVASIESGGIEDNSIHISVHYKAPTQHTTDWFVRYQSRDTYRTAGKVSSRGNDVSAFTTEVTLQDVVDVTLIYLRIYSTTEFVVIEFNNRAATVKGSVDIPERRNAIYIQDNIVAPTDSNTNMTIDVSVKLDSDFLRMLNESSKSVTDLVTEFGDMYIDCVNTTANPPELFEKVQGFPEQIFYIDVKSIDGSLINLTIDIPVEYVQYGCLFSLSIPENVSTNFISRLKHGVSIKVLSPVTNDVVPEGTVAVYPFPNETFIYTNRSTLTCFSMGNPHPEVTLFKQGQGQEFISLKQNQKLVDDLYTQLVGYTIETENIDNKGRYMCRAQSGKASTETTTEVIFVQPAVINVTETGVIENSTERTTIKCQASGKPRPSFELNLYEHFGPNLMQTGLYQVTTSTQGKDISIVTLTISPPDHRIHTVYCVTLQSDLRTTGDPMKIEIFPIEEAKETDWDFFNRLWDLINGLTQSTTTPSK